MKYLSTLVVAALLSGCSATYHLNKAVKKDPSILKPVTITVWDTIITPPVYLVDTVAVLDNGDSAVIENDTVKIVITKYQDKMIDRKSVV